MLSTKLAKMLSTVKVYESICSLRNEFGYILCWLIFIFFRAGNSSLPPAPQIINFTSLVLVYFIFLIKTDFFGIVEKDIPIQVDFTRFQRLRFYVGHMVIFSAFS